LEGTLMTTNGRRVAVLTGAAGGLGSNVARLLASSSHDLALVDIKGNKLTELASELRGSGIRVEGVAADLALSSECQRVIERTLTVFGRIDILINAAAILARTPLEEVTDETFARVFNINCKAAFFLAREAIKDMERRSWGRVVNITSIGVYEGGANMTSALYEASKGAVNVLTKMFAKYGAPKGVLVNTVCPGAMYTAMLLDETPPEVVKAYEARIPLGRLADPMEVAKAVVFLAGDDASYITGATFDVNGGLVMP
jgi:NAD(P)-dependent dehydrogenase (short-subunit alcohol dehydrogenase family)